MKLAENGRLKIAVQKKGRLTEESIRLFRTCGLEFEFVKESLYSPCLNYPLDILALRDDDTPEYVQDGVAELGIVGENVLYERGADVEVLAKLGFGKCRLMISIPERSSITNVRQLSGAKIATTYPTLLKNYLTVERISAVSVPISGSAELAPALNVADAVCDIVSTGTTSRLHGLRPLAKVIDSEAVLIANKAALKKDGTGNLIERLLIRLRGSIAARGKRYLMMNAPTSAVETLRSILPSMKSPTVMPLAEPGMVAIHSVVPDNVFWDVMEQLKKAGASDIVITPIEMIIQ